MLLLVLKVSSTLLAAFLSLVPMFVDLRTPQRRKLRMTCMTVLLIFASVSVVTQTVELKRQQQSTQRSLDQLLRIQTRLKDLKLYAEFHASPDAVTAEYWKCLRHGTKYVSVRSTVIFPGSSHVETKCPTHLPPLPIVIVVGVCKASATCHAVKPADLTAEFGDDEKKPCIEAITDQDTHDVRVSIACDVPLTAKPYLESISLNEIRSGSIRISMAATSSEGFPNARLFDQAILESATVELNGIPIELQANNVKKEGHNMFSYVYDLKSQDLSVLD